MLIPLAIAGFLLAHAGIHILFLGPRQPTIADGPAWPFATESSWLVTRFGVQPDAVRDLAFASVAVIVAAYALAAIVALGFGPAALWLPAVVIGSAASIGLLGICFHPWLSLGVGIDVVLLYAALIVGWVPASAPIR
jgi:hypothetical protein